MPNPPAREHSVETIRRNSEVMGNLRKLMVANRGVSSIFMHKNKHTTFFFLSGRGTDISYVSFIFRKFRFVSFVQPMNSP